MANVLGCNGEHDILGDILDVVTGALEVPRDED
jgi:hypothetical protein